MMNGKTYKSVDEYIGQFPEHTQIILKKIRKTVFAAAPEATETISYGMPCYRLHGNLIYFGGYKNHIGIYPTPSGITAFTKEIAPYIHGKGTAQLPLDQPIPYDLITKMVKFRVQESLKTK